jgi:hypothetical protein
MSRSVAEFQRKPGRKIVRKINQLSLRQKRDRTLQLQGNEALGLGVIEGYFTISIPTTIEPSVAMIDVVAPTGTTILIGNLMSSMYYRVSDGGSPTGYVFENKDPGDFYRTHLAWDCFLAYDARPKGSGTLTSIPQIVAAGVPHTTARITARIRANDPWSIPGGSDSVAYVFFQIRATMM